MNCSFAFGIDKASERSGVSRIQQYGEDNSVPMTLIHIGSVYVKGGTHTHLEQPPPTPLAVDKEVTADSYEKVFQFTSLSKIGY